MIQNAIAVERSLWEEWDKVQDAAQIELLRSEIKGMGDRIDATLRGLDDNIKLFLSRSGMRR